MKTTLALLTATLLLLVPPALSLAHQVRGHADGPSGRQERGWVQQGPHRGDLCGHQPPGHWLRYHKGHQGWDRHYRPPQHDHGHPRRERLPLGLPGIVLQLRW